MALEHVERAELVVQPDTDVAAAAAADADRDRLDGGAIEGGHLRRRTQADVVRTEIDDFADVGEGDGCQLLDDAIGRDAGARGAGIHRGADGELHIRPTQQGIAAQAGVSRRIAGAARRLGGVKGDEIFGDEDLHAMVHGRSLSGLGVRSTAGGHAGVVRSKSKKRAAKRPRVAEQRRSVVLFVTPAKAGVQSERWLKAKGWDCRAHEARNPGNKKPGARAGRISKDSILVPNQTLRRQRSR